MKFSLRSILLAIGVVGVWLGAMLSKSSVVVELATNVTALFLFLSIALAIWHPQSEQRKFWMGFCVLGLANLFVAHFFGGYLHTSQQLGVAIVGEENSGWTAVSATGAMPSSAPPQIVWAPSTPSGYMTYNPYEQMERTQYRSKLPRAVEAIASLLAACAGGCLIVWISRAKASSTRQ